MGIEGENGGGRRMNERMEEGGRRGQRRGLMCPGLGVESCCAKVCGSALTKPTPSSAGPRATVKNTTRVSADVAVPQR